MPLNTSSTDEEILAEVEGWISDLANEDYEGALNRVTTDPYQKLVTGTIGSGHCWLRPAEASPKWHCFSCHSNAGRRKWATEALGRPSKSS
jgi:hypothetical protein